MANINEYKRFHKPLADNKTKFKQGTYRPVNPYKVVGGSLIYRSSWEAQLCQWCDINDFVLKWGMECVSVPYRDKGGVDLEMCRKNNLNPNDPALWPIRDYFIDFFIMFKGKNYNGNPEDIRKVLVEVKPQSEYDMPVPPAQTAKLKDKKRFVNAVKKYATNTSKWDAARAFAKRNGMEFDIWTERTLRKMGVIGKTKYDKE